MMRHATFGLAGTVLLCLVAQWVQAEEDQSKELLQKLNTRTKSLSRAEQEFIGEMSNLTTNGKFDTIEFAEKYRKLTDEFSDMHKTLDEIDRLSTPEAKSFATASRAFLGWHKSFYKQCEFDILMAARKEARSKNGASRETIGVAAEKLEKLLVRSKSVEQKRLGRDLETTMKAFVQRYTKA